MIHAGLPPVRSGLTGLDRYRSRKNPTGCNSDVERDFVGICKLNRKYIILLYLS